MSFEDEARSFLNRFAHPRSAGVGASADAGDVLIGMSDPDPTDDEAALIAAARAWRRTLFDHGFGWIDGPAAYGGRELGADDRAIFQQMQGEFDLPDQGCFIVGLDIVAPAIAAHGTPEQKHRFLPALFRGDLFACQLFSEPSHGSDLAGAATRAERDGDEWRINGQKLWNSYAQFGDVGLLLTRTDPEQEKHRGLTMFLLDMRQPGVEVHPLRQMSGGANFNEVFLTDARVPDNCRLDAVGEGWRVAITTLMSEREAVGASREAPPALLVERLIDLWRDTDALPGVRRTHRDAVAAAAVLGPVLELTKDRLVSVAKGSPGPEMSILELLRNRFVFAALEVGDAIAGAGATADGGHPDSYLWGRATLMAPGMRIAGGTDEIQRNILAERVLGLPRDPGRS